MLIMVYIRYLRISIGDELLVLAGSLLNCTHSAAKESAAAWLHRSIIAAHGTASSPYAFAFKVSYPSIDS
jgi:hypothetical protein